MTGSHEVSKDISPRGYLDDQSKKAKADLDRQTIEDLHLTDDDMSANEDEDLVNPDYDPQNSASGVIQEFAGLDAEGLPPDSMLGSGT